MTTSLSHFGPLTTTFTPPADCFTEKWVQYNSNKTVLRWGAGCGTATYGYDSSCYPEGWSDIVTGRPNYKGFSPGLACPSGWSSALDGSSMVAQSESFRLSKFITSLGEHEVATACCPSGYGYDGQWCSRNSLTFSARPYISVDENKCSTTSAPFYNGRIGNGAIGAADFQARPVVLVRDTRSSYITPTATEAASAGASDEGLSTGAKIAIGVCVPVGTALIAAVVFVWFHRRRRARAAAASDLGAAGRNSSRNDPFAGRRELDGTVPATLHPSELDASHRSTGPAELSQDAVRVELPAHAGPDTPQSGLPRDGDSAAGGGIWKKDEKGDGEKR